MVDVAWCRIRWLPIHAEGWRLPAEGSEVCSGEGQGHRPRGLSWTWFWGVSGVRHSSTHLGRGQAALVLAEWLCWWDYRVQSCPWQGQEGHPQVVEWVSWEPHGLCAGTGGSLPTSEQTAGPGLPGWGLPRWGWRLGSKVLTVGGAKLEIRSRPKNPSTMASFRVKPRRPLNWQ